MNETEKNGHRPAAGIGFWFALWQAQFEAGLKFWAAMAGAGNMSARQLSEVAERQKAAAEPAAAPLRKAG